MKKYSYDIEYKTSKECFWEKSPAKYVRLFASEIISDFSGLRVLDLGAGEGKNAVFLASKGALVTAVDVSKIALSRFSSQPNYKLCSEKIVLIQSDVRSIEFNQNEFDIIISYGLFHALDNIIEINKLITKSLSWLKIGGYYIIVTFTNEIPPPPFQDYLNFNAFVNYYEFINLFRNVKIVAQEHDIITETHSTSRVEHQHSLIRLILQKT